MGLLVYSDIHIEQIFSVKSRELFSLVTHLIDIRVTIINTKYTFDLHCTDI